MSAPFPGLPAELKVMILLWLDGRSLHTCRQVSSSWDQFIRREVWASQVGRSQLERRLRLQWRHAQPTTSTFLEREEGEQVRAVSDSFVVSSQYLSQSGNNILKLTDVKTGECWVLDQVSCYHQGQVVLTDSLVIATTSTGGLRCWSLGSGQRIVKRNFVVPHIHFKLDQQANQILFLEEKKFCSHRLHFRRFEFNQSKLRREVREVCSSSFERSDYSLIEFQAPYVVVTAEGISSETHLIKLGVEKLLTVDGKFSIAKILFPKLLLLDNENGKSCSYLKVSLFNIESGNCIKHIQLPVYSITAQQNYPATLTSCGFRLAVIKTEYPDNIEGEGSEDEHEEPEEHFAFQTAINLLDLKSLLEEKEASFRRITVEGINDVFMTKTSVMASQPEDEELCWWSGHYKLNRWDFWNCKN